jgi:Predicted membrane protein
MGGAITMDNALPLYTALYGSSFALYAFANGVLLTAVVPVVVPPIHQLCPRCYQPTEVLCGLLLWCLKGGTP